MTAHFLPIPESDARRRAREIVDANVGESLISMVAQAWLEGHIAALKVAKEITARAPLAAVEAMVAADPAPTKERHEYDAFCSRCGKRDGSRLSRVPPAEGFFQVVCFHCSAGDEPRAA